MLHEIKDVISDANTVIESTPSMFTKLRLKLSQSTICPAGDGGGWGGVGTEGGEGWVNT